MRKALIMPLVCLAGIFLNIALPRLSIYHAGIPLYLDTIFTITVTLSCGLVWGIVCGAMTNIISHSISGIGWEPYLFTICNIATAVITWLFRRYFQTELMTDQLPVQKSNQPGRAMDRIIVLIIFSFTLCITMSVLGGLIATFIMYLNSAYTEGDGISGILSTTMFGQNVPVLWREIISRIPVNIVDRLISAFAGYGIAVLLHRLQKRNANQV